MFTYTAQAHYVFTCIYKIILYFLVRLRVSKEKWVNFIEYTPSVFNEYFFSFTEFFIGALGMGKAVLRNI